jgi:hypothetical protein
MVVPTARSSAMIHVLAALGGASCQGNRLCYSGIAACMSGWQSMQYICS